MTAAQNLNALEESYRDTAESEAQKNWGERAGGMEAIRSKNQWPDDAYVFRRTIPDNIRFRADAGHRIAYLDQRAANQSTRGYIDALGEQVARRISL